mmetsp:Transcript_96757/g.270836  ORF Transcript_96757/g.270836 Transcript_96757/m.270836 type:complete len:437 (+) Transcript_96757:85-1395(+)
MPPGCTFTQVLRPLGDVSVRSSTGFSDLFVARDDSIRTGLRGSPPSSAKGGPGMLYQVSETSAAPLDGEEDRPPLMMRRSNSAASKRSGTSSDAVIKPAFRRSQSAGSAWSAKTEQSSTSAPPHVDFASTRAQNSLRISRHAAHETFEFVDKLGEGGFGEVWRATRKQTPSEVFAIKLIPVSENKEQVPRLERELKVFERLTHPYIVRLHEVFLDEDYLYLVMDECTGGNLVYFMETFADDPERIIRKIERPDYVRGLPAHMVGRLLWQMLVGIAYMHHHRFCHRDIKLQNYVIKEPAKLPVLQLVDFGMAVRFKKGGVITGTAGTVKYMAPEVLDGRYTEKCDIWAIGIVSYILCTDSAPWGQKKTNGELYHAIMEDRDHPLPPCDKPNSLRALVGTMLTRDYVARPSAKELLKSSRWLRQYAGIGGDALCCAVS